MKNLDCNQIKIFIILEIIGEEDKEKKYYIYFFYKYKKIAIFMCGNIILKTIYGLDGHFFLHRFR